MAGSLVLLDSVTASSSASVTLGTTDWDNSYNVYMVKGFGIENRTDLEDLRGRVTTSGTPDSDSQYDHAFKLFKASGSFADESNTNQDHWRLIDGLGNATNEQAEFIMYLFNFNNSYPIAVCKYHLLKSKLVGFQNLFGIYFTGYCAPCISPLSSTISVLKQ